MERSASILIIKIHLFTSRDTFLFPNNNLCFMVGRGVVLVIFTKSNTVQFRQILYNKSQKYGYNPLNP